MTNDHFRFCLVCWIWSGVSFVKPCDTSYEQLTHRRNHKLILLTNYSIALGCIARVALRCITWRGHMLRWWLDGRTRGTNIFGKDTPGIMRASRNVHLIHDEKYSDTTLLIWIFSVYSTDIFQPRIQKRNSNTKKSMNGWSKKQRKKVYMYIQEDSHGLLAHLLAMWSSITEYLLYRVRDRKQWCSNSLLWWTNSVVTNKISVSGVSTANWH